MKMGTWAEVRPGMKLSIKNHVYRVQRVTYPETVWDGKPAGIFTLLTPGGGEKSGRVSLENSVKIIQDEEPSEDEAAVTARVVLGAVEIGERDLSDEIWRCPEQMDEATFTYHMKFFHYGEIYHDPETAHIPHTHQEN